MWSLLSTEGVDCSTQTDHCLLSSTGRDRAPVCGDGVETVMINGIMMEDDSKVE